MSPIVALTLAVLLIFGNGFFVGVEFALLAARKTLLQPLAQDSRGARKAISAIDQLPLMVATCQFGITLCSLGLGAVGEPAVSHLLEPTFEYVGLPEALVYPLSFVLALMVVSVLHMLIGEMVPKNIALAGPERMAVVLTPALLVFLRAFRPVVTGLTRAANVVLKLLKVAPVEESASSYSPEQVAALVAEARREGLLGRREHRLLTSVLDLERRTSEAVLLPLRDLVTVSEAVTPAEVEDLVASTGFSRFPVASVDARGSTVLRGYVHLADVLDIGPRKRFLAVPPAVIRPLATVRLEDPLQIVLSTLQRSGAHLSRVVDGTGRTLGVLALEDVLEELVGEVRDLTARRPD